MPVVSAMTGGTGSPVTGSMKSSGERRTSDSVISGLAMRLAVADDLGLLGGDREDHDLLLLIEDGARGGGGHGLAFGASSGGGATGGSSVPSTCMPWRRSLTVAPLGPGLTTITPVRVRRIRRDRRELLLGQGDERVDVVAGLDDGADAAGLVDANGDRAQARPASGHR